MYCSWKCATFQSFFGGSVEDSRGELAKNWSAQLTTTYKNELEGVKKAFFKQIVPNPLL